MTQPTIVFSPLQAGVPAAGGALEVLARVQAPDRPADLATAHLPKRLALVVDRSFSLAMPAKFWTASRTGVFRLRLKMGSGMG
jgi:hypothetical protein